MINNPPFELLRKHKQVSIETEELVMKKVRNVSQDELFTIFENGITGQYGKIYSLDPQTLMSWIYEYNKNKSKGSSYLSSSLLDPKLKTSDRGYVSSLEDWMKEANKAFTAFLNGVNEIYFHPHIYDRMMVDGKIELNTCMKYLQGEYKDEDVVKAKQKVLRDVFLTYKSNAFTYIYFIKE